MRVLMRVLVAAAVSLAAVRVLGLTRTPATVGQWRFNLPPWCREEVVKLHARTGIDISDRLNPYDLQGDFNGGRKGDVAVLAIEPKNGKAGILVFLRGDPNPSILGAGRDFGNGGDDFSWMALWSVLEKGDFGRGAEGGAPPGARGDALMVTDRESVGGLMYWDGQSFRWYQQGD
jgi:hypothetical protein